MFCDGLLIAVRTLGTKKYWRRSAACCIVKTTAHRIACSHLQWLCENWWLSTEAPNSAAPGPLWFVLVLHFVLAPPGGALRPGLVPAGWGALGGCPLARFGGETAPPLVH